MNIERKLKTQNCEGHFYGNTTKLFRFALSVLSFAFPLAIPHVVSAAAAPVLTFTDLVIGPNTGNSDTSHGQVAGADGAIVTVWGKYLGASQGGSQVTFNGTPARVYTWGNATAPADLFTRHKMQMI